MSAMATGMVSIGIPDVAISSSISDRWINKRNSVSLLGNNLNLVVTQSILQRIKGSAQ